ncbi:hypothetical protein F4780DRAFT_783482 [Xylariomycetidae sp. FL0641]|nr:hypothetical protein F4780DRAFT_783482 [Xylariomycetidae sp. FL0641]
MTSLSIRERRSASLPADSSNSDAEGSAHDSASTHDDDNNDNNNNGRRKRQRREANVYDAVAGRVTTTHALHDDYDTPHRHDRASTRDPKLAPEEVLFRRVGAPARFAEKDIYWTAGAGRAEAVAQLPDGDLLQAAHVYASEFYGALGRADRRAQEAGPRRQRGGEGINLDERSMDETALLALGILLEEAGRDVLGRRGDLVFTEGVEVGEDGEEDWEADAVGFLDALEGRGGRGRLRQRRVKLE